MSEHMRQAWPKERIRRLTSSDVLESDIAVQYFDLMSLLTSRAKVMTVEWVKETISKSMERSIWVFGAFYCGNLVGIASMHVMFLEQGAVGSVQNVVTHPDFRRKGVCRGLFATIQEIARTRYPKSSGVDGIYKLTLNAKPDATKVYESFGWEPHEQEYEFRM